MRRVLLFCLFSSSALADVEMSGKLHLSADYVDYGATTEVASASNGSRFSFKGTESLNEDFVALWKLETEVDVSGESAELKPRNRYVGIVSYLGTVLAGYHDTPFRSMLDKIDLLPDTIADSRAILGATKVEVDEGNGVVVRYTDRFNLRARNALMYVSPPIAGLEVRALLAPGEGRANDDAGTTSIASFSAVYKSQILYFGAAYEQQWRFPDTGATRYIGGLQFENTQVNLLFEQLDSSRYATLDRMAGGASVLQRIGDATIEAQAFRSRDYFQKAETGGTIYAVGATYKLSKQSEIYGIVARMDNEANAGFMLAAGDHGEHYLPAATGARVHSASMGMVFKF